MLNLKSRVRLIYQLYDYDQNRCIDSAWMFSFEVHFANQEFSDQNIKREWVHIEGAFLEATLQLPFGGNSIN